MRKPSKKKSCEGKMKYQSVDEALAARNRVFERSGVNLSVYRCSFCGKYHIGHSYQFKQWNR